MIGCGEGSGCSEESRCDEGSGEVLRQAKKGGASTRVHIDWREA
jgi:hypothetical protein